jgi:hypothetical protein
LAILDRLGLGAAPTCRPTLKENDRSQKSVGVDHRYGSEAGFYGMAAAGYVGGGVHRHG